MVHPTPSLISDRVYELVANVYNIVDGYSYKHDNTCGFNNSKVPVHCINRKDKAENYRAYAKNCDKASYNVERCENQNHEAEHYREESRAESVLHKLGL